MRGFLVPGERKGYQSLKSLIIIQRVEHDKTITEDTIRVSSWRGADQVQDLRGHLFRKNSYHVVELSLVNCFVLDREVECLLEQTRLPPFLARKQAASSRRWLPAELHLKFRLGERVPQYPPGQVFLL